MSPESPSFYLQYAGGLSKPHESQDKSSGWREFFSAQCLVSDGQTMVTMKTSEISPTGAMAVLTSEPGNPEIKNLDDVTLPMATAHLQTVSTVMQTLEEMLPTDRVKLWHINNSFELPNKKPTDLGIPHPDVPAFSSQTVGTLHSHCDSISGEKFIKINSLNNLKREHAKHLGVDVNDSKVKSFLSERRRNTSPRGFQRISEELWNSSLQNALITQFPDVFAAASDTPHEDIEIPLPSFSLTVKGGWDTLQSPRFAEAVLLTHHTIQSTWEEISTALKNGETIDPSNRLLKRMSKIVEPDRSIVPNQKNWLHEKYNYTLGIVQWDTGPLTFFIDPKPDVVTGVQSTGIHSVRETRELSVDENTQRDLFRRELTRRLLERNSQLNIGAEGAYLLSHQEP